ncbi:MAG: hypothetical protein O6929_03335 [candidate division NC10 bacterium]|nr:hypothetical protein [candidate division NC10 bacterium]
MHGLYEEGLIRFQADHRAAVLDPQVHGPVARSIIAWWDRLVRAGTVGCDPNRYGGVGFGNLSGRLPPFPGPPGARPLLVTGTQTGSWPSGRPRTRPAGRSSTYSHAPSASMPLVWPVQPGWIYYFCPCGAPLEDCKMWGNSPRVMATVTMSASCRKTTSLEGATSETWGILVRRRGNGRDTEEIMLTTKSFSEYRIAAVPTGDDPEEWRRRRELLAWVREGDRWARGFMDRFYGMKHWHSRDGIILGGKSKTCPLCAFNPYFVPPTA